MERTLVAELDSGFQKLSVCLCVCSLENLIVCCLFEEGDLTKADGLGSLLQEEVVVIH